MSYFRISIKKALHYKWHNVYSIMGSLLYLAVTILLWKYIYRENAQMQRYMTVYAVLSNLISLIYSNRYADSIADKVYKGTFAVDLLRPISFLKLNLTEVSGEIVAGFLVRGIPMGAILFYIYRELLKDIDLIYALLGIAALVLAFLFHMMVFTMIGFLSFRFYEIWPFNRLMNDTIRFFSGSFIPIALFPAWLQLPVRLMPFRYLYSFPIELILDGSRCENIGLNFMILIVWNVVMAAAMLFTYRRVLFHCVVQGG